MSSSPLGSGQFIHQREEHGGGLEYDPNQEEGDLELNRIVLGHRWNEVEELMILEEEEEDEDLYPDTVEDSYREGMGKVSNLCLRILFIMVTDPTLFPNNNNNNNSGGQDPVDNDPMVQKVVSKCDINGRSGSLNGRTLLMVASSLGIGNTVEKLLEAGADPNLTDFNGVGALMVAAMGGYASLCLKLMRYGADPNQVDGSGMGPLGLASMEGHYDVVRALLSNQECAIDLCDKFGWTSLMLASYLGFGEVVELLLVSGADREMVELGGRMAMDLAGEAGHYRIARRLNQPNPMGLGDRPSEGGLLDDGDAMDDISLDSDDQKEIQRRFDREDTLDSRSTGTPRTASPVGTLRSRKRVGTLKGMGVAELPMSNLGTNSEEEEGESRWEMFSRLVTMCCVPGMLGGFGGMRDASVQQAWREKVALCVIILVISSGLGFLTFGFSSMVCKKVIPIFPDQVLREYGARSKKMRLMIVRGQLYDTGSYFPVGNHRPILPFLDEDLTPIIDTYYGNDISDFFPVDRASSQCRYWPTMDGADDPCRRLGKNPKMYCHTSHESLDQLEKLSINNYVAFSWQNISSSPDKLFIFNERVFSLKEYLDPANKDRHFGKELDPVLAGFVGRDATKDIIRHPKLTSLVPCFEEQLLVGRLDGTTIGCFASNLVMLLATSILMTITVIKFTAAMLFDWFLSWKLGKISAKHRPRDTLSHILLLVTCYSEGEHSLRTTLDSLALSDYDDDHKLLFVIADGDVTGSGNAKSTPDLLLDMLEPYHPGSRRAPTPRLYISIGDGPKQSNMARVHMGHYVVDDHRVPFLLVIKCGCNSERGQPKAGNRGKRDSQLILMRWLSSICFNSRMTPLEYDLSEKVRALCGITPDRYDMVLMVDADTVVLPDAVSRMVAAMERDPAIMGLCGETKITNKSQSWVTMIQVYEYYISHHLGKAFESIFGGVTCLPGCFCMYRIKIPKSDGYAVPILANPDIVTNYSSNDVSTLHKKNLLLLGEDRYLTTLMLRAFPKRKMIYVPQAICKTMVPDEFAVLLSQRRRWINSTIHNLLELVLVPQLCGIFCCSMQFVIFLELLGTVVMPASLLFLFYLIIGAFVGMDVLMPLLFMAALFLLQAVLILLTTRKVSYIAWMLIYILALPVWNFVLPAYSFWHFDDFSWGATRKIDGPDAGHGGGSGASACQTVPARRWAEWQKISIERRERRDANQLRRIEAKKERNRITRQQALAEAHREKYTKHHQTRMALFRFQEASIPTSYQGILIEKSEEMPSIVSSPAPDNSTHLQSSPIPSITTNPTSITNNPSPQPSLLTNPIDPFQSHPVRKPRGPRPKRVSQHIPTTTLQQQQQHPPPPITQETPIDSESSIISFQPASIGPQGPRADPSEMIPPPSVTPNLPHNDGTSIYLDAAEREVDRLLMLQLNNDP